MPTSKAQQEFTQMRINSKIQLSQLNFGLTDINKDVVIIYTAWFKYTHFKQVHYLNHIHKQIIIRNKKYHLYKIFSLKKSCAHVFFMSVTTVSDSTEKNALNYKALHLQQRATFTFDKSNKITEYIHRNINIHSTLSN